MNIEIQLDDDKVQNILELKNLKHDKRTIEEICHDIINSGVETYLVSQEAEYDKPCPDIGYYMPSKQEIVDYISLYKKANGHSPCPIEIQNFIVNHKIKVKILEKCTMFSQPYFRALDLVHNKVITCPQYRVDFQQ